MAYISKQDAIANIKFRNREINGKIYSSYETYVGIDPLRGFARKLYAKTEAKMKLVIARFYAKLSAGGDAAAVLSIRQAFDAYAAFEELKKRNLDMTLLECVKRFAALKVDEGIVDGKNLGDAYTEYVKSFEEGSANRKAIENRVGKWVKSFGDRRLVADVTEAEVLEYLEKYDAAKTYNNVLTYIKTFLNWCTGKNRRYLIENPLSETKTRKIIWKRPEFISASDAKQLFTALNNNKKHPELLAYAIASFFCGIRRDEIIRGANEDDAVVWDIPHSTAMIIKVKRFTQGAHPRSFTIPENAMAWINSFDFAKSYKMINERTTKMLFDFALAIGLDLPKNAGRHSFITQHIAAYDNIPLTCKMAGTSEAMVRNNYCGLSHKEDGLSYFSIIPTK